MADMKPAEALTTCTNAKAAPLDMPKMMATIEGLNLDALVLWFRERAVLHKKFGEAADAITKLRAAKPEVAPDDEALIDAFFDEAKHEGDYGPARLALRRHIAGLRDELMAAEHTAGAEQLRREIAEAALAGVRDKTIEECAALADACELDIRDDAPSTGNAIRALKDKEPTNG